MTYSIEYMSNPSSSNPLDRPEVTLEKLSEELFNLMIQEIEILQNHPFDYKKSHDLRPPWEGFMGWYPNINSKIKNYRIIYRVDGKIRIYRIGHRSQVYKK